MDNISSYALQHQYEQPEMEPLEYSADCYLDWDIFTFENEILERARIYKENLQALNLMADTTAVVNIKEETNSRKEYQQLKLALQKGIEMYHSNFDINVTTKALSDTTYEALLRFDFHVNEVLLPEEEEDIRSKFGNLDNLPGLLCALREIVLKK
ncbi:hypothetical protein NQ314_000266 [Rhamnusium bicolor]|uniref:Uncharacterized protein n=1 Tax=Rhamnusium bicolor TaxID=1586634 RepID=A0AAV8ZX83_9CUCU|nr:hypothetical protein NQ314_000266 [Rhamnusium bicolor]